ncbi:hypothetical protein GCM10010342_77520 [Streptomyces anulatus]|nr:hypothetical protein GCM10010342_77520 [Streptomyces anulatus]
MLFPYGGPLPVGHTVHDVESAAWREWAAMVYPRAACASPWTRRSAGHSRTSPRSLGSGTSTVLKLNRGAQLRLQAAQTPASSIEQRRREESVTAAPGWAVKQGPLGSSPWPGVIIVR